MVSKKRVQAYVPPSTYRWLETVAENEEISVSQVVTDMIQTVEAGGVFSQAAFNNQYATKSEIDAVMSAFMKDVMILVGREVERRVLTLEESLSLAGLAHLGYDPTLPFQIEPEDVKKLKEIKQRILENGANRIAEKSKAVSQQNIPEKKTTPKTTKKPQNNGF
jgi:hypothetical protein